METQIKAALDGTFMRFIPDGMDFDAGGFRKEFVALDFLPDYRKTIKLFNQR